MAATRAAARRFLLRLAEASFRLFLFATAASILLVTMLRMKPQRKL